MTELVVKIQTNIWLAGWHELPPVSRWRFGSPCKFVRSIDLATHIILPELIQPFAPKTANYLRTTSPRWGRTWRNW